MSWITVTAPNGQRASIAAEHIVRVRPWPATSPPEVKARIDLVTGDEQYTHETHDEIMSMLMPLEK
jgi:hypothetical protein